jgi:hypothetical protein
LLRAIPDFAIHVHRRHLAEEAVLLEVIISVDGENRLAGEKIYYDRAKLLRQLGIFHEPDRMVGRIEAAIMHPLTIAQAIWRKILQP